MMYRQSNLLSARLHSVVRFGLYKLHNHMLAELRFGLHFGTFVEHLKFFPTAQSGDQKTKSASLIVQYKAIRFWVLGIANQRSSCRMATVCLRSALRSIVRKTQTALLSMGKHNAPQMSLSSL
jgi:hypothetical protein